MKMKQYISELILVMDIWQAALFLINVFSDKAERLYFMDGSDEHLRHLNTLYRL